MKALLESLPPGERDWELAQAIDPARLPAHIAIIMDGNGRWAGRRRLPRVAGHKAGIGPGALDGGNLRAPGRQSAHPVRLFGGELEAAAARSGNAVAAAALLPQAGASRTAEERYPPAGHRAAGSAAARRCAASWNAAVEATAANRGLLVNLAINYGGRAEIVDAVNAILEMARLDGSIASLKLDEDLIATNLYTASCPDPDLLIRTSGEMRISNFLLWQIAYVGVVRHRNVVAGFHAHRPAAGRAGIPEARPPLWRTQRGQSTATRRPPVTRP